MLDPITALTLVVVFAGIITALAVVSFVLGLLKNRQK